MLLKHLEKKKRQPAYKGHGEIIVDGSDGKTKGHVVFSKYENVDVSASYFENGSFSTCWMAF